MLGKTKVQADRELLASMGSPLLAYSTGADMLPPPYVIGLPERYQTWRTAQQIAVLAASYSDKRFVFQCAPTGFGKSLSYMANSRLESGRTIILTSTKGLQDQLIGDFSEIGLRSVKGKNAYDCIEATSQGWAKGTSVADGPCHVGYDCPSRGPCLYFKALRDAKQSNVVVTNYAAWMYIQQDSGGDKEPPLGHFDLMICDEAHDAPEWVSKFMEVEITRDDFNLLGSQEVQRGADITDWMEWARYWSDRVDVMIRDMQRGTHGATTGAARKYQDLKKLGRKISILAGMRREGWVMEEVDEGEGMRKGKHRVNRFAPVDPSPYTENVLFKNIKKVVLYSATVRPKTADLLGIKVGSYEFNEYPSTFPLHRRPVLHIPTIRLGFRSTTAELAIWLSRIDAIIRGRLDRKGLIHTVSFKRRNYIIENSQFGHGGIFITNDSRNTKDVVAEFKQAGGGKVLISPSMTTGWDFPYDQCEYQIIGKLPFPDMSSGIMKARDARDKQYSNYITSQVLVQTSGRGMRAEDDQCETFIIDDNIEWFVSSCKRNGFLPQWWLDAYTSQRNGLIPPPPPKLPKRLRPDDMDNTGEVSDEQWEHSEIWPCEHCAALDPNYLRKGPPR